MQFFTIIWESITSIPWITYYLVVKYIFLGLIVITTAAFLVLLPYAWNYGKVKFRRKQETKKQRELEDPELIRRQWETIIIKSETSPPDSLLQGIMEADALLDEVLKEMGLPGEHFADRIESINPETTKSVERLWRAHSIKNNLMRGSEFITLTEHEARVVLSDYEAFLKEIGIWDL